MLNTIGMSEGILKLIEKRTRTDMIIFVVLVIACLLLIYVLIAYVKPFLSGTSSPLTQLDEN